MAKSSLLNSVLVIARSHHRTDPDEGIHGLIAALARRCGSLKAISLSFELPEIQSPGSSAFRQVVRGWQVVDGVATYAVSMPWSPSDAIGTVARWLTTPALEIWAGWPSRELDAAAHSASLIILHSEPALVLLGRLRKLAPRATIVIYADDPQAAANMHPRLQSALSRNGPSFDHVVVTARSMVKHFEVFGRPVTYVPRGLDLPVDAQVVAGMFGRTTKVVCAATTTLDASVVQIAAAALPDAEVHLVGSSISHRYPGNVQTHAPMSKERFAALLGSAKLGIVPLAGQDNADGLADTDVALLHFGHFGVPAVCPTFAAGGWPLRFGYQPGRSASIRDALACAVLARPGSGRVPALSWSEVARLVLEAVGQQGSHAEVGGKAQAREVVYEG